MNRRYVPSIGELAAFAAAARHENFSRAAQELNLSQGAISRLIRHLEDKLQVRLFERVRQRVLLTRNGEDYLRDIEVILAQIERSTRRVRAGAGGRTILNIASLPTFGTLWLVPRLPAFAEEMPEITINVAARIDPQDLNLGDYDAVIHYGALIWPNTTLFPLMDEVVYPVCTPKYREQHSLWTVEDLGRARLLHILTRPEAWSRWLEQAGLKRSAGYNGPQYAQFSMALQAALSNFGVVLFPKIFIERELAKGDLVILFKEPPLLGESYSVVVPEARLDAARPFVNWIQRMATGAIEARF